MSLQEKLDKIKSPKLQNQKEASVVLNAIEDTLRDQAQERTPTGYFAALLALLSQALRPSDDPTPSTPNPRAARIVNKPLATSVVYLLDTVAPHVPTPLLRAKCAAVLGALAPVLALAPQPRADVDAPLLRPALGALATVLSAQDAAAWDRPGSQAGSPRGALAAILALAADPRPKVRKRAQEAVAEVLRRPPPGPLAQHPAADLCAETALAAVRDAAGARRGGGARAGRGAREPSPDQQLPALMHALQLVRAVAGAGSGWPGRRLDGLCEALLAATRAAGAEYPVRAALDVLDVVLAGIAADAGSAAAVDKLERLLAALDALRPHRNDAQLLPPWIAVLTRAHAAAAQLTPEAEFARLPQALEGLTGYLAANVADVRTSAAEGMIALLSTCVPESLLWGPNAGGEDGLRRICDVVGALLSVQNQQGWSEALRVLASLYDSLRWRATPFLHDTLRTVGELRSSAGFASKTEADAVIAAACRAVGPEAVLQILPLNLSNATTKQPGRAWMLPLLRDNIMNTRLAHFRTDFVPLSEKIYEKGLEDKARDKSMQSKVYETLVEQIWSLLPGYCTLPLDLRESFDTTFAELLANLLYRQPNLRAYICRALGLLVESNQELLSLEEGEQSLFDQNRVTRADAQANIEYLATFASNLLAVLFNIYNETLPQFRGYILQCINAFLSITAENELLETFYKVGEMLKESMKGLQPAKKGKKRNQSANDVPNTSHALMDLVITLSGHLPRSSYPDLFSLAAEVLPQDADAQLQKKAYKLIPRIATTETGRQALQDRSAELQALLLSTVASVSVPARRDRLAAIATVVDTLPPDDLYFIPAVLPEVVIAAKEVNEKAREAAYSLLVAMGHKMAAGGVVVQSKVPGMAADAPDVAASLEEFFTMVSAGLAGATPHMISASVNALTRLAYEFRAALAPAALDALAGALLAFLGAGDREIARSALGFAKLAAVALPEASARARLGELVPGILKWSRDHGKLRARVKHLLERLLRRFGADAVLRHTPEADRKIVAAVQKAKEQKKRRKERAQQAAADGADGSVADEAPADPAPEAALDRALADSDSDAGSGASSDSDDGGGVALPRGTGRRGGARKNGTGDAYIVEDEDEPLDLLDRGALAHIATSRPVRFRPLPPKRRTARTTADGKLVLGPPDAGANGTAAAAATANTEMADAADGGGGGVGAYVEAIRGKDAPQRGQRGRLKFSNRKRAEAPLADGEDGRMDVDEDGTDQAGKRGPRPANGVGGQGNFRGGKRPERRGLDGTKVRGGGQGIRSGRVMKNGSNGVSRRGGRR